MMVCHLPVYSNILETLFAAVIIEWCINIEVIVAELTPSIFVSLFLTLIVSLSIFLLSYCSINL